MAVSDPYTWFDPYAAREDALYWEDRARYETREIERYAEGYKGENRAMKAHIEYLTSLISRLVPPSLFSPVIVPRDSVGVGVRIHD